MKIEDTTYTVGAELGSLSAGADPTHKAPEEWMTAEPKGAAEDSDDPFPAITYAIAPTVMEPSRMSTRPISKLADIINGVAPVPQSKIDEFVAKGLEGKALSDAIKCEGLILHFGQYPERAPKRQSGNIEASTGAAFDFDFRNGDRTSRADVVAAAEAKGVAVILWDTYSSGIDASDDDMTFRAMFPFSETQAINMHAGRCNLIAEQLGFTAPGKPLPVTQGFFVQPRLGRKANARAVPGGYVDKILDFRTLPIDETYPVKPLIIFDTTNACFEVENENDAAEVGRVMSSLKQSGAPVWIIGHLAKSIERNDIKGMTGRGSSAWEADSQGTAFIFAENEDTDVRYMATKKRRFEPCYIEVKYITSTDHEVVIAPWGEEQHIRFRYGVPERASPGQRKEEAAKRQLAQDCAEVEKYLRGQVEPVSKATIEKNCEVPQKRVRVAVEDLLRRKLITNDNEYPSGNRIRKDGHRLAVLDLDSPSP